MKLSFSQVQTYERCPKQYDFACIQRIPRAISAGESYGSSIHNTLKYWGEAELRKQSTSIEEQVSLFSEPEHGVQDALTETYLQTLLRENFIADGYTSSQERQHALERGKIAMKHVYEWWRQVERRIVAIEEGFSMTINGNIPDGITVTGRFDRVEIVEGELVIYDYKTSKEQSQELVDTNAQLTLYALAAERKYQKPVRSLSLIFIGEDACREVITVRTEDQKKEFLQRIQDTGLSIISKDFHALPGEKKCSMCPYRVRCVEGKRMLR